VHDCTTLAGRVKAECARARTVTVMTTIDASEYERAAEQLVADAQAVVDRADAVQRARAARGVLGPGARERSMRAIAPRRAAAIATATARASRSITARAAARLAQIRLTE